MPKEEKPRRKSTIRLIPLNICFRVLKKHSERVSRNGAVELSRVLEDYAEKIGEKAGQLAKHSGRKTIKEEDIKLAIK